VIPRAQRKTAITALIHRYAARLEDIARQAPYNWFNFYDFWGVEAPHTDADHAAADHATPNRPV
jgi:predicted LPLAT superfamily acyltransferase